LPKDLGAELTGVVDRPATYSVTASTGTRRDLPIFTDRNSPDRINRNTVERLILRA